MQNTMVEFKESYDNKQLEVGIDWQSDYIPSINDRLVLNKFVWKNKENTYKENIVLNYETNKKNSKNTSKNLIVISGIITFVLIILSFIFNISVELITFLFFGSEILIYFIKTRTDTILKELENIKKKPNEEWLDKF